MPWLKIEKKDILLPPVITQTTVSVVPEDLVEGIPAKKYAPGSYFTTPSGTIYVRLGEAISWARER